MNPPKLLISWEKNAPHAELQEDDIASAGQVYLTALGLQDVVVNLLLAGDETLADLNLRFRDKDGPTDVLSWIYADDPDSDEPWADPEPLYGEIAISLDQVQTQAAENGWDLRTELLRLLAHGCTHLAGYDHETAPEEREMRAIEIRLLEKTGLTGIYPP